MSLRLETLQVAKLAPQLLGDSAELVRDFVLGQLDPSGGFLDRDGKPDLYYTVFGLDCLHALSATGSAEIPTEQIASYLDSFGCGDDLDLIHLSCLARCWAALPSVPAKSTGVSPQVLDAMLTRFEACQTEDGGYADRPAADQPAGSVYGSFVALGAYQDLGMLPPDPEALAAFVATTARSDGAYADGGDAGAATLPVTAAAVALLRNLGAPGINQASLLPTGALTASGTTARWLRAQCHPQGGFLAVPGAPMPDLLSTAVALHTLAGLEVSLAAMTEPCLDFIDSLWTNRGAFHGHWADDVVDCEYTYYGLLALGHLSVWAR